MLDTAVHDITLALEELIIDDAPLCLAQALHHDLLGGLCRYAAEVCRRDLDLDRITDGIILIDGLGIAQRYLRDIIEDRIVLDDSLYRVYMIDARVPGQGNADVLRRVEVAFIGGSQRSLYGLEYDFLLDAPLFAQLSEIGQELLSLVHCRLLCLLCSSRQNIYPPIGLVFYMIVRIAAIRTLYADAPAQ